MFFVAHCGREHMCMNPANDKCEGGEVESDAEGGIAVETDRPE